MGFLSHVFVFDDNKKRNESVQGVVKSINPKIKIDFVYNLDIISDYIKNKVRVVLENGGDVMVIMNSVAAFDKHGLKELLEVERTIINKTRKLIFSCQSGKQNNKAAQQDGVSPDVFISIKSTGRNALDNLWLKIRGYS